MSPHGKMKAVEVPSIAEMHDSIAELLACTRYFPEQDFPKDKYGMPIVAPEPDDPDDE